MTEWESIEQFEDLALEEEARRLELEYESITVPDKLEEYFTELEKSE